MSTVPTILPVTKFRVPRLRAGTVLREGLLERLDAATRTHPVTVVCAPGGSGKTTLLAQLAARIRDAGGAAVWIAIDEDDDDANRLFASLVQGLEPLGLAWEHAPATLAARVVGAGASMRAALAAAVNALCTSVVERIVLVFDDVHRLGRPESLALLESLVERLPEHVAVAVGTRVEPALPLARWRVHGEVTEFTLSDLRFSEAEAFALAGVEHDGHPAAPVADALRRTQGWAVGLSMLLHSSGVPPGRDGRTQVAPASGERGQRRLFAYLAQEVLEALPADLREFALRCSILAELSPEACRALTGREDAAEVLAELDRRDLFLSLVDEAGPVLRFHDLFREFLENELARRLAREDLRALHERAARAESTPARAVHHYLAGEFWGEALRLILSAGESLVAAGAIGTLERWIDQVPEPVRRGHAHVAYLRGSCAWLRWDWDRARAELAHAVAGLTAPAEAPMRARACFMLVDAASSGGDMAEAWARLAQAAELPLDALGLAELASLRAWCHALDGQLERAGVQMREFVAHAEAHPERVCPLIAGRVHPLLMGVPAVPEVFERFAVAARHAAPAQPAPWQLTTLVIEGWVHFWRGDRAATQAVLDRAEALYQQFGAIRLLAQRLDQLRVLHAAALGRDEDALQLARRQTEALQAPELERHRAVWTRAYQHGYARLLWMAGRDHAFLAAVPALTAPRRAGEHGFVDVAADVVRGQAALIEGRPRAALEPLGRACEAYARYRLPTVFCDPRISLAQAWLALRDRRRAWQAFEPLYRELAPRSDVGPLLLDSRRVVAAVLEALPADVGTTPETQRMRERLEDWARPAEREASKASGPLARLSEREREVLAAVAEGAGNKHIARALDLSLHTVKRHIANILDKLDCASRGQAAEIYRRTQAH